MYAIRSYYALSAATEKTRVTLLTAHRAGAVAVFHLYGPGVRQALEDVTGREGFQFGRAYLTDIVGVDRNNFV